MKLRQLHQFVAVAETGSFTQAAQRVHLVQSALSTSIATLERDLGTRLFDRTTRSVELTAAGRALLPEARGTLQAAGRAREVVQEAAGGMRGTVRVGIMHATTAIDLAGLIGSFLRERPHVVIEPSTDRAGSAGLAARVLDHSLDMAFAAAGGEHRGELHQKDLASESIRLLCPPGHHLGSRQWANLEELTDQRFIDVPVTWGSRMSVDRLFARHDLRRVVAIEVGDVATVAQLVDAGLGIALIAPSSAPEQVRARMIDVRPAPIFMVSLVTSTTRPLSAAAQAFVRHVTAHS